MDFGHIPEMPSAFGFDIERRRNVPLELRAERNRRLDRPSVSTRMGQWFERRRSTRRERRSLGMQTRPDLPTQG